METVKIQVREQGKKWEETHHTQLTFDNWKEIATFAYRLSLVTGQEIRVESKGNGHYYSPMNASEYLRDAGK